MSQALERGIAELKRFLGDSAYQLKPVKTKLWEAAAFSYLLPPDYKNVRRTLRISFPDEFPYELPKFAITPSAFQIWPHVMIYGVCLFAANQEPATTSPEEAVAVAMEQLIKLIKFSLKDSDPVAREKEFSREIRSYWLNQLSASPSRFTLVKLPVETGPIFVVSENANNPLNSKRYIGAASYEAISRFEKRYKGTPLKQRATAKPAFFLKLDSTPPNIINKDNLLGWIEGHVTPDVFYTLNRWFENTSDLPIRWLILSLPTAETALQGFVFTEKNIDLKKKHATLYGRRTTRRKFFPTKQNLNLRFSTIDVLDAEVIHHRAGPAAKGLATKKVVLVGAGSLGGEVAVLLARSGVGSLYVIDHDKFEDVNIGRHTLGVPELGEYKSEALAKKINRDVPTVDVDYSTNRIQSDNKNHTKALSEADLVIVTTASWNSEDYLWNLKSKGTTWALIQAWSEPHGVVGHILSAPADGNHDARYLFDKGNFVEAMSEWAEGGVIALAACGGGYIPGGPVALAKIAGQTVQHALNQLIQPKENPEWHAIVGSTKKIEEYGGKYKGPALPEEIEGGEFSRPWPTPKPAGGE
jgi:sulfur-carrier protein adenylyltransferase/sulfurtransferase